MHTLIDFIQRMVRRKHVNSCLYKPMQQNIEEKTMLIEFLIWREWPTWNWKHIFVAVKNSGENAVQNSADRVLAWEGIAHRKTVLSLPSATKNCRWAHMMLTKFVSCRWEIWSANMCALGHSSWNTLNWQGACPESCPSEAALRKDVLSVPLIIKVLEWMKTMLTEFVFFTEDPSAKMCFRSHPKTAVSVAHLFRQAHVRKTPLVRKEKLPVRHCGSPQASCKHTADASPIQVYYHTTF